MDAEANAVQMQMRSQKITPKQRKFADVYLATGNASEAYRQSYNCSKSSKTTIGRKAQETLTSGTVTAYLASIQIPAQEKVAKAYEITLESITAMLLADRGRAEALEASAAAVSAARDCAMSLAKLHGLIVDTVDNRNEKFVVGVEKLMDEGSFERKHKLGVATATRSASYAH